MAKAKEYGMRDGEGGHGMGMHTPDPGGPEDLDRMASSSCSKASAMLDAVNGAKAAKRNAPPKPHGHMVK